MQSNSFLSDLVELSESDLSWLEQETKITSVKSPKKRKEKEEEFKKFLQTQCKNPKKTKGDMKTASLINTPEKMKCRVAEQTVWSPGGKQYAIKNVIGEGGSGTVYACQAIDGKTIALKKRIDFLFSPHKEAKRAAQFAQKLYGYGAYFCPKPSHTHGPCKDQPHYLTMPYFAGKNPEEILENYFDAIAGKENKASLAMFAMFSVFIALTEAYDDLRIKEIFHGDVKPQNMQLTFPSPFHQLKAEVIDFDHARDIGELTCGEAALYQGSELNQKIPADSRSDVYSIGNFFDETLKLLIEKEIYDSREIGNTTDRGLLNPFATEMDLLEGLIERMLQDKNEESYKSRPDFATVLSELKALFKVVKDKLVMHGPNDFNEEAFFHLAMQSSTKILDETTTIAPSSSTKLSPLQQYNTFSQPSLSSSKENVPDQLQSQLSQ